MQRGYCSFVVRIWYESVDSQGAVQAWRGSIDLVGDDKRSYFQDLDQLIEVIREQAKLPAPQAEQ